MTDLPPFEDAWHSLHLTLDGKGGGVLTIGGATWHVRAWQKVGTGQARAEVQPPRDPEWEKYLERISALARA